MSATTLVKLLVLKHKLANTAHIVAVGSVCSGNILNISGTLGFVLLLNTPLESL